MPDCAKSSSCDSWLPVPTPVVPKVIGRPAFFRSSTVAKPEDGAVTST
jgi:hypothetical protein